MKTPTWIYHKTLQAKIINETDVDKYLDEGWALTPAVFKDPKTEEVGFIKRSDALVKTVNKKG